MNDEGARSRTKVLFNVFPPRTEEGNQISAARRMDWVKSVVRYQYWWEKQPQSQNIWNQRLTAKNRSEPVTTKPGINCETWFAIHGTANTVEVHIPETKQKRKQSEKVIRKADQVEAGTLCHQTKESAYSCLSQSYLESSWSTRSSTSYMLTKKLLGKLSFGSLCHLWGF